MRRLRNAVTLDAIVEDNVEVYLHMVKNQLDEVINLAVLY
jgi:hypothetical protein